jgi:hypothetical protein
LFRLSNQASACFNPLFLVYVIIITIIIVNSIFSYVLNAKKNKKFLQQHYPEPSSRDLISAINEKGIPMNNNKKIIINLLPLLLATILTITVLEATTTATTVMAQQITPHQGGGEAD